MLCEQLLGSHEASLDLINVLGRFLHESLRVFGMLGEFARAIHVQRKCCVTSGGQLFRLLTGKLIVPPPFVHHQNTGALAFGFIVVRHVAGKRFAVYGVFHGFCLHVGCHLSACQGKGYCE